MACACGMHFTWCIDSGLLIYRDQQHCRNNQPEAAVPLAKIEKVTLDYSYRVAAFATHCFSL